METQIKSFYHTPQGIKFVTIFGYSTRAIPSLEINGVGKLSKNIKEKLIYVTRVRKLKIPSKRFVLCVEMNEFDERNTQYLKWLEFPLLLMYWHLSGLVPISKLDDCLASGSLSSSGEIAHLCPAKNFSQAMSGHFSPKELEQLKYIADGNIDVGPLWQIEASLLLGHIEDLKFMAA